MLAIFLTIFLFYIIFVFFDLRLLVPYLGFGTEAISQTLPQELVDEIEKIGNEATSNEEFLKKSYDYITSRFHGDRFKTIYQCFYAFRPLFSHRTGYLPCSMQNQLLKIMLIKSSRFQSQDIRVKTTVVDFFIHQYMEVRLDNGWIPVDPWGKSLGIPFGEYAFGFV
ncbi:MAG TPA: hypothetical protein VN711_00285 [Candidatus Saccharimonadales bacterium]|nr:hypothetical protein [Candidatus Saccharimonadales bacterium]